MTGPLVARGGLYRPNVIRVRCQSEANLIVSGPFDWLICSLMVPVLKARCRCRFRPEEKAGTVLCFWWPTPTYLLVENLHLSDPTRSGQMSQIFKTEKTREIQLVRPTEVCGKV